VKQLTTIATLVLLALLAGCPAPGEDARAEVDAETQDEVAPDTTVRTDTAGSGTTALPAEAAVKNPPEPPPEPKTEPIAEPASRPDTPPPTPPKPTVLPRMWAFGADRCIPCIQMRPFLTELVDEYAGKIEVKRFDVYLDREAATQARIQMIPTQIFYDPEGKEIFRHVGFYEKDSIIAKFRQFGWE
jgi:thioredoxin 1